MTDELREGVKQLVRNARYEPIALGEDKQFIQDVADQILSLVSQKLAENDREHT